MRQAGCFLFLGLVLQGAAVGQPASVAQAEQALNAAMSSGETLSSALAIAVGYQTAKELGSELWTRRLRRLAGQAADGASLIAALDQGSLREGTPEHAALSLARSLAVSPQGPGGAAFRLARQHFTDAQLVEITSTVAYYCYAIRLTQALGPQDRADDRLPPITEPAIAQTRISIPGPDQASFLAETQANTPPPLRALFHVPKRGRALLRLRSAILASASDTSRTARLFAGFTSAHLNGCRYATTAAVHVLLAAGVPAKKIAGATESDRGLSAQEKAVVAFARKLTIQPGAVSPADFRNLEQAVGKRAAMDVLLETAWSSLFERLADGMNISPEPAAQRSYREVFGHDFPSASEQSSPPKR